MIESHQPTMREKMKEFTWRRYQLRFIPYLHWNLPGYRICQRVHLISLHFQMTQIDIWANPTSHYSITTVTCPSQLHPHSFIEHTLTMCLIWCVCVLINPQTAASRYRSSRDRLSALRLHAPKLLILLWRTLYSWILMSRVYVSRWPSNQTVGARILIEQPSRRVAPPVNDVIY